MLKKLFVVAAVVVAVGAMVGVSTAKALVPNIDPTKVTLCHRTNAANNPYVIITVDVNAVNGGGKDDHSSHTGPVATDFATATALKKSHIKWGDIIPPYTGNPVGYNWDPAGQAIFTNGCAYPPLQLPTPLVDYTVVCDVPHLQAIVTFTNTGNASGVAQLNGAPVVVTTAGTVVNVPTPVGGTQITIVINNVIVFNQLVNCQPSKGGGGGTITPPTKPTTPTKLTVSAVPVAASLPFTAGDNTKAITIVASAIATLTVILSVIAKTALLKQL